MKKLLFTSLIAMLFALAAHAEPVIGDGDTLWTKPYTGIKGVKFHPSGETVIVSREWNGLFELDAETGEYIRTFTHSLPLPSQDTYWDFDISSDGNYLFAVDYAKRCYLWNYHTGQFLRGFDQEGWSVKSLANSNNFFIMTKRSDYNFWVYNTQQDSVVRVELKNVYSTPYLSAIAVSPDSRYFALASIGEDYIGNTVNSIALYNAQTFEHVIDINKDEPGYIDEIEFSENAKWVAYKTDTYQAGIIDLNHLINTSQKIVQFGNWWGYSKFSPNEQFVLFSTNYPEDKTFIMNLNSHDTIYKINSYSVFPSYDRISNKLVLYTGTLKMFNSNWHLLNVPDITEDSTHITQLNYNNYLLSYSTNLLQINSITITNTIGTTLYSNSYFCQTEGVVELPLSSGLYFFTINDGQNSFSRKFVVVR